MTSLNTSLVNTVYQTYNPSPTTQVDPAYSNYQQARAAHWDAVARRIFTTHEPRRFGHLRLKW